MSSLSAWQRWEMGSFSPRASKEPPVAPAASPAPAPAPAAPLGPIEAVRVIDEKEMERLRALARKAGEAEGRALGLAQGREQGREEGRQAALDEVRAQAAPLLEVARSLPAALRSAEREVADQFLALALDLARQLAGAALQVDHTIVLSVVRDLLATEPTIAGAPRMLLHPHDAQLVREHLGEELQTAGWTVQPDADITRGGCLVKAASGELDATVETRRQRVEAALAARISSPRP